MKVKEFKPANKSDVPEMPEWMERVLKPIVDQVGHITEVLGGRLVPGENTQEETRTVVVRSGEPVEITLLAKWKATGVSVLTIDPQAYFLPPKWETLDLGKVRVTIALSSTPTGFSSPPSGDFSVTLRIQG